MGQVAAALSQLGMHGPEAAVAYAVFLTPEDFQTLTDRPLWPSQLEARALYGRYKPSTARSGHSPGLFDGSTDTPPHGF